MATVTGRHIAELATVNIGEKVAAAYGLGGWGSESSATGNSGSARNAPSQGETMYDINKFIKQVQEKKISTDGADNGQCTAVPHLWQKLNHWPIVRGNAKDTFANAPSSYTKVHNSASNYPPKGAIVVWGSSWGGGYGHTGVVVSANAHTFKAVEQNNGDHGLAHVVTHAHYNGVLGWFVHK